jgi:hypothetical protein
MQLDPLTDDYPELTPFQYASCDPITNIDIDGLEGGGAVGGAVGAGRDFSYAASAVNSAMSYVTPIFRAVGAGSTSIKASSLIGTVGKISSIVIQTAITAGNLINNKTNTEQVGSQISWGNSTGAMNKGSGGWMSDWWQDITNDYIRDPSKLKLIQDALVNASGLLVNRLNELKRWNKSDKANFKKHFGRDDDIARDKILTRIRKEYNLIVKFLAKNNYKKQFFETSSDLYGHVYNNDPDNEIYLDKDFWTANPTGTDSQAGTIIHEMSHFNNIGGTTDDDSNGDPIYEIPKIKRMILSDPDQALKHANTFEYYLEGAF